MTSFHRSPEMIAEMMGLPEENWFNALDRSQNWGSLVPNPVGDLAETEGVFRKVWATAESLVQSKPREFLFGGADTPEAIAAAGAFRAIGATEIADMIEKKRSSRDLRRHTSDARDLLIRYLNERGVFPLEPATKDPK